MLLLENNNSYEARLGYPVYYNNNNNGDGSNGYLPSTPYLHHHQSGFAKSSEWGFQAGNSSPAAYQSTLVYPQFPTPPLSPPAPSSVVVLQQQQQRLGDSFQIRRILDLDDSTKADYGHEEDEQQYQSHCLAMRTASVIMKIEDQRVFQVDSTSTGLIDEDSYFDKEQRRLPDLHQQRQAPELESETGSAAVTPTSESFIVCKWERCFK